MDIKGKVTMTTIGYVELDKKDIRGLIKDALNKQGIETEELNIEFRDQHISVSWAKIL